MTLEEMGLDYLRQAEAIKPDLEAKKQEFKDIYKKGGNLAQVTHELTVLQDIYDDLIDNGYRLINYYRIKEEL